MTARSLFVCAALSVVLLPTTALAVDLTVTGPVTISTPTTYDNVIVTGTGVLTVDAPLTVTSNMTVQSGGVVTHSLRLLTGLVLNVGGTLEVQAGGAIDVSAKGLRGGGAGGSAFGTRGETYDPVTDAIVAGANSASIRGAGGGYGGLGGSSSNGPVSNPVYGLLEDPLHLGSGGGGEGTAAGGHGGGRLTITAGSAVVNGQLLANGGPSVQVGGNVPGAGSGGTVRLQVTGLSGSGQIQAQGGAGILFGTQASGAGGGGRVAIHYTTSSLPIGNVSARGGNGGNTGAAGTIYLKDVALPAGDVVVDNGNVASAQVTPLRTAFATVRSLTGSARGQIALVSAQLTALSVEQPVPLTGTAALTVGSGVTLSVTNASGFDLNVQSGSTLTLSAGSVLNADRVRVNGAGSTLNTSIALSFPNATDLELSGSPTATLNVLNNVTLSLGVFDGTNVQSGTVNLTAGSRLDVASNAVTVGNTVTLVKDGAFGPSDQVGSLTVLSGGNVTHSLRLLTGLVLNVGGTLEVQAGGAIDVSAKGLRGGGAGGSAFGTRGETYDPVTDAIVAGANSASIRGAGGGDGGLGGSSSNGPVSNPVYGLLEDPLHLGSGGGGEGTAAGGHGGGRLTITAGSAVVNGQLLANGGPSVQVGGNVPGAGSGGTVRLQVTGLSGSGQIQAQGGAGILFGTQASGAGGGGRVAIHYTTSSLPIGNVSARGGNGGNTGAAGTIYLKDVALPAGDVVVDNGNVASAQVTPLRTAFATVRSLTGSARGQIALVSAQLTALSVEQPVPLTGTAALTVGSGVTLSVTNASGFDLNVQSGSTLTLSAGSVLNADRVRVNGAGSTLNTSIALSFPNATDLELSGSPTATLNVLNNVTLSLGVFDGTNVQSGTVNLTAGSRLDVASNAVTVGNTVTLVKDGAFGPSDQVGSLTVLSGGNVTHSLRLLTGLVLNVGGTLEVQAGGAIDVSAKGLRGGGAGGSAFGTRGETYDPVTDAIVAGANSASIRGAGGGYGGLGGSSSNGPVSNPVYGLLEDPLHLGSGGGGEGTAAGGHGGGRLTITAGSAVVNGQLLANGGPSVQVGGNVPGAGSGGTVRLQVTGLSGSGQIQAQGGAGILFGTQASGAGGGGRVAVFKCQNDLPLANITAPGGTGGNAGQPGTVYITNIPKTITATAGPNGSVSPSGAVPVLCGDNQTFTITPNAGYLIENVLVDGSPVGPQATYTFVDVTQPHTISATFTVANTAPQIAAIGPQTAAEGTALTLTVNVTDAETPPQALTFSLDPSAPAGASIHASTGEFTWTPTEVQGPGDYSVTVRVTDSGNPVLDDTETFAIHVNEVNQAPLLAAIGEQTVAEGSVLAFTATATDADLPPVGLTFSLDTGSPASASITAGGEFTWTPTEAQGPADHTLTVRVSDGTAEDFETITVHVTEGNEPPVLAAIVDASQVQGASLTFMASATDPDLPANVLSFAISAGLEPGMSIDASSGVFIWAIPAAHPIGPYPVTVRVSDDGAPSLSQEQSFTLTVLESNHPPVLQVPASANGAEGSPMALTASATDSDLPAQSLTFSLVPPSPAGASIHATTGVVTWIPSDNGSVTFRVRVEDGAGGMAEADVPVTITNVAPSPVILSPSTGHIVAVGTSVSFSGSITDPGAADTHDAVWTIDGVSVPGVVEQSTHTVSASHTFTSAGVYLFTLTVTDDDGDSGAVSTVDGMEAMVVVYDPSAGYVSGAGWLQSPAGAYAADPGLTGKANFGFISRYKKGETIPSGDTDFIFKAGGFRFNSTAYDWLVVSGTKAKYKGTGTVNGAGDFGFMLTALDGDLKKLDDPDRLRMKVWDKASGQVVYDNMLGAADSTTPSTAIGGGAVIIHKQPNGAGGGGPAAMGEVESGIVAFRVGDAFPNPSNGASRILLGLPGNAHVVASVFDLAGRQVVELTDRAFEAGEHSIQWAGTDMRGSHVRPGMYFVRVEVRGSAGAPGGRFVRRVLRVD